MLVLVVTLENEVAAVVSIVVSSFSLLSFCLLLVAKFLRMKCFYYFYFLLALFSLNVTRKKHPSPLPSKWEQNEDDQSFSFFPSGLYIDGKVNFFLSLFVIVFIYFCFIPVPV